MAAIGESLLNSIALTIRATDKINQLTGGRDRILKNSSSGGAASSLLSLNSAGQSSLGISESGKGLKVNISA